MSTDAAATADISTMPAFGGFTFEVGEGLPELPANATAYEFPPGAEADESTVAALAEALGVGAPPEPVDDESTGLLWRAGPDDGTAPSLGVSRDPQLSWYYSGAWADQPGMVCREVEPADSLLDEPADPSLDVDDHGDESSSVATPSPATWEPVPIRACHRNPPPACRRQQRPRPGPTTC